MRIYGINYCNHRNCFYCIRVYQMQNKKIYSANLVELSEVWIKNTWQMCFLVKLLADITRHPYTFWRSVFHLPQVVFFYFDSYKNIILTFSCQLSLLSSTFFWFQKNTILIFYYYFFYFAQRYFKIFWLWFKKNIYNPHFLLSPFTKSMIFYFGSKRI